MKTDFNFENAKVGDEVYHVTKGWTEIKRKHLSCFVLYENEYFLDNGKISKADLNPTVYPYNPFEQNQERVVEVRDFDHADWVKRVLIMTRLGKAVCWVNAENLDSSKSKSDTHSWNQWREIEPQKELTQEEKINILWEKYGNDIC